MKKLHYQLLIVITLYFFLGMAIGLTLFPLVYMLITHDYPGARIFYGIQEDHWLVGLVLALVK